MLDSLGTSDVYVREKLKLPKGSYQFNTQALQPLGSKSCGLFVSFLAIYRLSNLDISLQRLLRTFFSDNLVKNEKLVKDFFDNHDQ